MILIADSGSTKTDWTLLSGSACGNVNADFPQNHLCGDTITTQGVTPIHQSATTIRTILEEELKPRLAMLRPSAGDNGSTPSPSSVNDSSLSIFFYGSGCTPAHIPMMRQLLEEAFPGSQAEAYGDLLGAARALCGREAGIACILGTGANSGLYDGQEIIQNTPALGYILGDEGSGAVLGRMFMNAIFKYPDYRNIRDQYLTSQQLTQSDIIQRVYREPMANRFLASTSLFIGEHIDNPLLQQLVIENFRQFFRLNIAPYRHPELPVHFVGSMAYHYPALLAQAAQAEGFTVGQVLKSPLPGLVRYHQSAVMG